MRVIGIAIMSLLLMGFVACRGHLVTLYFVPFEIETYVPISTSTIACDAREKWTIDDTFQIEQLASLLKQGKKAAFDDKRVRVQISGYDQIYYIDAEGVVLKGKTSYRINKAALVQYLKSLNIRQRIDVKPRECEPKD